MPESCSAPLFESAYATAIASQALKAMTAATACGTAPVAALPLPPPPPLPSPSPPPSLSAAGDGEAVGDTEGVGLGLLVGSGLGSGTGASGLSLMGSAHTAAGSGQVTVPEYPATDFATPASELVQMTVTSETPLLPGGSVIVTCAVDWQRYSKQPAPATVPEKPEFSSVESKQSELSPYV